MNAFFLTVLKTTVLHFLSFDDVSKCDLIVYFIRLKAVNSIFLIPNTHTVCIVTHSQLVLIYLVWLVTASRLVLDLQL